MITQPKSLLLQGLQFAQMAAFCIKGTGPQWAAGATGLSVLIDILWPSARPQTITAAQFKYDIAQLKQELESTVWAGFQSVYQAKLDAAIGDWSSIFDDVATGKLDIDLTTAVGQVDAAAWKRLMNQSLDYASWTSTNPLPEIWNWAADQAPLQATRAAPEATRLQTFAFYSSAAGCFLNWTTLGLFAEYSQIQNTIAAGNKQGKKNLAAHKPKYPADNPKSPYFSAQLQALDLFITYVEGGTVSIKDAKGKASIKTYPGVLTPIRNGRAQLPKAIASVQQSAKYKNLILKSDPQLGYHFDDPDTGQTRYLGTGLTKQQAQAKVNTVKNMLEAEAIGQVTHQYFLNVLSSAEIQHIEDTLEQWKEAKLQLDTLVRRHSSHQT